MHYALGYTITILPYVYVPVYRISKPTTCISWCSSYGSSDSLPSTVDENTFERRYLRITKWFHKLTEIWPDQNTCIKCFAWVITAVEMLSSVFVQVSVYYVEQRHFIIERSFYAVNVLICSILFLQLPWTTRLLARLQHFNTTPMIFIIPGYYFVNEHEIFYLIQLLTRQLGNNICGTHSHIGCDSSLTIVPQHICGLLIVTV
ncbi:uncharacterized protein LOC113464609 [Ceratina calcarata]|uniref:Uncharacterized protein LOC113464609 n=1 Tax=Ceratina calcarata TaxID=156304 RepID=A0AAJ7S4A6_9HYME|nr:uncharacterized protein LOC113464609 [Ceratina calcarata]